MRIAAEPRVLEAERRKCLLIKPFEAEALEPGERSTVAHGKARKLRVALRKGETRVRIDAIALFIVLLAAGFAVTPPATAEEPAGQTAESAPEAPIDRETDAEARSPESPPAVAGETTMTLTAEGAEAQGAVSLQLEEVLRQVLSKNAQIRESEGDVDIARAQRERARAAGYPRGEAMILGAAVPEETGDAINSVTNLSKWGPFVRVSAQLFQPLFTFGQLGGYRNAADSQIAAKASLADAKRNSVVLTAKEYYYSFAMARELEKLVEGLVGFLEEAVSAAEESSKKKKRDAVKPHDLYRLKVVLEDLRQKKLMASAGLKTARRAVEWVSATPKIELNGVRLEPERHVLKPLDEYVRLAKETRPELKALAAGQAARASLRDAKRAQSYPTIFVGGFIAIPWAPTRQKQNSVFANDPFNQMAGGGGIGLRFDLEFARHSAEAAEEQAELMKLKATADYAAPGIELEVRKAYWEVEQGREGLALATKRRDLAKRWFVSNAMGWSVGVTQAKDLLEALQGEGEAKQNYIQTVFALNMALGKLSQAVGKEVTELKYR
jgi:outer membrane protein TolC